MNLIFRFIVLYFMFILFFRCLYTLEISILSISFQGHIFTLYFIINSLFLYYLVLYIIFFIFILLRFIVFHFFPTHYILFKLAICFISFFFYFYADKGNLFRLLSIYQVPANITAQETLRGSCVLCATSGITTKKFF